MQQRRATFVKKPLQEVKPPQGISPELIAEWKRQLDITFNYLDHVMGQQKPPQYNPEEMTVGTPIAPTPVTTLSTIEDTEEELKEWKYFSKDERHTWRRFVRAVPPPQEYVSRPEDAAMTCSKVKLDITAPSRLILENLIDYDFCQASIDSYYDGAEYLMDLTNEMGFDSQDDDEKGADYKYATKTSRVWLMFMRDKIGWPVAPREFLFVLAYRKLNHSASGKDYALCTMSVEHPDIKGHSDAVRGGLHLCVSAIQALTPSHSILTRVVNVHLNGWVSSSMAASFWQEEIKFNEQFRLFCQLQYQEMLAERPRVEERQQQEEAQLTTTTSSS